MNLRFPLSVDQQLIMTDLLAQEQELIENDREPVELVLSELDAGTLGAGPASTFRGEYRTYPVTIQRVSCSHFKYIDVASEDNEEAPTAKFAVGHCY